MSRKYPPEVHQFIVENVVGTPTAKLAAMTNAAFGTAFTAASMSSYKKNYGLRSGLPPSYPGMRRSRVFPPEVAAYIAANYRGVGPTEMAARLNDLFGTDYTQKQLDSYYNRHHLDSGLTGRFEKGHVSCNKGVKGLYYPGSEKGYFKKGSTPHNKMPIGTVITKSDGFLWKKTGEGARDWKQLHLILWEEANGPVPDGYLVTFKDSNKQNCVLENMMLITRGENAVMNRSGLRFRTPEHTETGLLIAKVKIAAAKKKRRQHGNQ